MLKHSPLQYLLAFAFLVIIIVNGYGVPRYESGPLFACYFLLFAGYLIILRNSNTFDDSQLSFWIIASILFRASLLFSIPALSDDFYRFIWDGRVLAAGANPFSEVPSYYMDPTHSLPGLDENLYEKLNSKHRFSSYPPVCQFIYWISVKLSPDSIHGSVLVMKNILLLFEIATIWAIKRLTPKFNIPAASVLIYALNPLVILEISGNLHFEGIMVFFLMMAISLFLRRKRIASSAAYALSICTKLIPLIILPFFFHALGKRRALAYWLMTAVALFLLYLPFLNADIISGYSTSLGYYFQHFEFNASVYYVVRAIGYLLFGFNIIQFAGPVLALTAAGLIIKIIFRPWQFTYSNEIDAEIFKAMTWCLFIYFLSSTIVHPWYIITLVAISIFAGYRFPIVWTGLIFLTYEGYTKTAYEENLYLVAFEYTVVVIFFLFEAVWKHRKNPS